MSGGLSLGEGALCPAVLATGLCTTLMRVPPETNCPASRSHCPCPIFCLTFICFYSSPILIPLSNQTPGIHSTTSDFLPEAMPWAFMSPFRPHHSPLELTLKLTLEQCEGWGQPTPTQLKITYNFELPKTPVLSIRRGLVPGPLCIPKSTDAQVPYRKWPRTKDSQPQCHSQERRRLAVYILKKFTGKWTHVVQTQSFSKFKGQLYYYPHLQMRRLRCSKVTCLALSHTPGEWSAGI